MEFQNLVDKSKRQKKVFGSEMPQNGPLGRVFGSAPRLGLCGEPHFTQEQRTTQSYLQGMVGLVKFLQECLQIHLVNDSLAIELGVHQFLLAILCEDDLK